MDKIGYIGPIPDTSFQWGREAEDQQATQEHACRKDEGKTGGTENKNEDCERRINRMKSGASEFFERAQISCKNSKWLPECKEPSLLCGRYVCNKHRRCTSAHNETACAVKYPAQTSRDPRQMKHPV